MNILPWNFGSDIFQIFLKYWYFIFLILWPRVEINHNLCSWEWSLNTTSTAISKTRKSPVHCNSLPCKDNNTHNNHLLGGPVFEAVWKIFRHWITNLVKMGIKVSRGIVWATRWVLKSIRSWMSILLWDTIHIWGTKQSWQCNTFVLPYVELVICVIYEQTPSHSLIDVVNSNFSDNDLQVKTHKILI